MEFEKLGAFYLGKQYDCEAHRLMDNLLMYDARDLTTHAVCVGMTGSGKTGLCIDLLEEAAIDQVPAIILDPKGDITNLLLQFPDLQPEDFRPWVNVDDARRKGLNLDEYASRQAESWRSGLESWGQSGSRIRMLQESADFAIYTPGSDSGIPVSILKALSAPPSMSWDSDSELLRERIEGTVGALLSLIGADPDPVQSREHVLLANIFEHFWRQREDLDLTKLILAIQNPPIRRLGVFDLDTFFPPKERAQLAMSLNNLLASPSFQSWLSGEALDIGNFLTTPEGKPRHSVFYLAHLDEAERIFFVAMLLNEFVSWMRGQPGTTSLRALIYMDEIFGFFPPVAQPPSKKPMLTLLKQARAFGVGLVLATQNPVDLDYKGLTNAGTWFIGRLQTDRDKKRVLDGLDGASSDAGEKLSRSELSRLISNLDKRVFLMHNVHEEAPVTFHTRWAMSYLRGPLTRTQIQELMADRRSAPSERAETGETSAAQQKSPTTAAYSEGYSRNPPALSRGIQQVYLRVTRDHPSACLEIERAEGGPIQQHERKLLYKPVLFACGRVHFVNRRRRVEEMEEYALINSAVDRTGPFHWDESFRLTETDVSRLYGSIPEEESRFEQIPDSINEVSEFSSLERSLNDYLYRTRSLTLFHSKVLNEYSVAGESEGDFRVRLRQMAREARDEEVEKLSRLYRTRLRRIEDRIRKAQITVDKKETTAQGRSRELLVSVGESLVGMFLGRRSLRSASSSLSKYRMRSSAKVAVQEAEVQVERLEREFAGLEDELREKSSGIVERWESAVEELQPVPISPRRNDVEIDMLGVGWEPYWLITYSDRNGVKRTQALRAFSR